MSKSKAEDLKKAAKEIGLAVAKAANGLAYVIEALTKVPKGSSMAIHKVARELSHAFGEKKDFSKERFQYATELLQKAYKDAIKENEEAEKAGKKPVASQEELNKILKMAEICSNYASNPPSWEEIKAIEDKLSNVNIQNPFVKPAGRLKTAGKAFLNIPLNIVALILEIVSLADAAVIDNALVNKIEDLWANAGDKNKEERGKFAKWLNEHPRAMATLTYLLSLGMVCFLFYQCTFTEFAENMKGWFNENTTKVEELFDEAKEKINGVLSEKEKNQVNKLNQKKNQEREPGVKTNPSPEDDCIIVTNEKNLTEIAELNDTTVEELQKLNHLPDPDKIHKGDKIHIHGTWVRLNENLWTLANRFHTTVDELMKINGLKSAKIYVNQYLFIRPPKPVVKAQEIEPETIVQKETPKPDNVKPGPKEPVRPAPEVKVEVVSDREEIKKQAAKDFYEIKPGEKLQDIANRFGIPVTELQKLNRLSNPNKIKAGDKIHLHSIKVTKNDTLDGLAKEFHTTRAELTKINGLKSARINIGDYLFIRQPKQVVKKQERKIEPKEPDPKKPKQFVNTILGFEYGNDINFDDIRKTIRQNPRIALDIFWEINNNPEYEEIFKEVVVDTEGFEPDAYNIGDGYITQGCGMTYDFCLLPQEKITPETFKRSVRVKPNSIYAPIVNLLGSIRSYNDLWAQVHAFCLDPSHNPYEIFQYLLYNTRIKSMSYTQFAVIMSAAFQSKNMAKQILDRLSSGEIKAPYKTNVDWAFHTDQKAGGQPLRNNKEQKVFVSGEAQSEIVIGQHHAKKKQSFTNAKAFLNANKAKGNAKEGNNFDVYYDRNIDTNQKTALFKALYGGMYPEAKHLRLTSHDVELIKELKRTHGSKWEERFTKLIATAEANAKIAEAKKGTGRTKKANIKLAEKAKQAAIKVRDLKAQKKILLFILNNPEKVMRNPKIVIEKLNGWNEAENEYMPQEQQDQTMLAEGGQPSPEELIAMTNNMRGFGY